MSTVTNRFSVDFLQSVVPFFAEIKKTAEILGAQTYLVGGSVRDILSKRQIADVDIVPFGVPYNIFAKTLAKQIKAPAINFKDNIRIMKNSVVIDVSNPRGENIEEDLSLRDFTINNLACDTFGSIIGDCSDIDNKIIRLVHPNAFDDDPLRILRAFRFKSKLGFEIHQETQKLINLKKHLITKPAAERIVEELRKTFEGKYFASLFADNLFRSVIQIIAPSASLNPENVLRLKGMVDSKGDFFPIFMVLFFEGEASLKFFQRLPLSSKIQKHISNLLKASKNIDFAILDNSYERRKIVWRYYNEIADLITLLKCKYPKKSEILEKLSEDTLLVDPTKAAAIDGNYLKQSGFLPSPIFSTILDDVKEKLVLGDIDPKDIKKYIADNYIQKGSK